MARTREEVKHLDAIHSYDRYKRGDRVVINYTGVRAQRGPLMTEVVGDNLRATKTTGDSYNIGVSKRSAFNEAVVVLPECPCCRPLIESASPTISPF